MDIRTTFGIKTLNTQRARADRFVTPRESFPEIRRRVLWNHHREREQRAVRIWDPKYLQQKNYMNYLDEAFGLEPLKAQDFLNAEEDESLCLQSWPCRPRKKCYLSSADSVLDLPMYRQAPFPELLDWSSYNILVAALGRSYHKWSWRSQSLICQGIAQEDIYCCKFDPKGELLLLGTDMKTVEIHDSAVNKRVSRIFCGCPVVCCITAIDWSPTGNSFVLGCSNGMLSSCCRQWQVVTYRYLVPNAILLVRVSPDARFVAAASVNAGAIHLLSWPDLKLIYSYLGSGITIVKALTWHPWRSALLGIGTVTSTIGARITLWDARSSKKLETNLATTGSTLSSLDAMLFSHRTGELVISVWRSGAFPKAGARLIVMSDPETVVDRCGESRATIDHMRTMVFSPDGTKLATATADEDLIIWNFLPEDKIKRKKNHTRFSALPMYLDEAAYGFSLR